MSADGIFISNNVELGGIDQNSSLENAHRVLLDKNKRPHPFWGETMDSFLKFVGFFEDRLGPGIDASFFWIL